MSGDIFISYKSEEKEQADRVRSVLEDNGFSCWMDTDGIGGGADFTEEIPDALNKCKVVVILLSEASQKSPWVNKELKSAVNLGKKIIPYQIEDCELEEKIGFTLSDIQIVSAYADEKKALENVIESIRADFSPDDQGAPIIINIRPVKKTSPWLFAAAGVIVAALLFALFLRPKPQPQAEETLTASPEVTEVRTDTVDVYYSKLLPFTLSGFYQTSQDADTIGNIMETPGGFSILSFIKNSTGSVQFVEDISCEISNLVPITEPDIIPGFAVHDNVLKVFIMNNGWGDAEDVHLSTIISPGNPHPEFASVNDVFDFVLTEDVASEEVVTVRSMALDTAEVDAWCRQEGKSGKISLDTISLVCDDNGYGTLAALYYNTDTQQFTLEPYGFGDIDYSVSLFAVLDVDEDPNVIHFTGSDATPAVDDVFRIETVIAPTKSCTVTCRDVYSVGGEYQATPEYTITVRVPVYDTIFHIPDFMFEELAAVPDGDTIQFQNILNSYRYRPEAIRDLGNQ